MSRIVFREKFRALVASVTKHFAILAKLAKERIFLIVIKYNCQKLQKHHT